MAAVDTKRGYVGMCNGRSAQQESGAALSKTACLRRGPKILYSYYARCALIRDCRQTAWDDFRGGWKRRQSHVTETAPPHLLITFLAF